MRSKRKCQTHWLLVFLALFFLGTDILFFHHTFDLSQYLVFLYSRSQTFSSISCDYSLGPTCAFTNVCLTRTGSKTSGYFYELSFAYNHSYTNLSPNYFQPKVPTELTAAVNGGVGDLHIHVKLVKSPSFVMPKRFIESAVLGALYGAENFGHHVVDIWFPLYRLRQFFLSRFPMQRDVALVLAKSCEEYDFQYAGLSPPLRTEEKFTRMCQSHVNTFSPLSEFSHLVIPPNGEPMCFKHLVLGASSMRYFDLSHIRTTQFLQPEFEAYKDQVVRKVFMNSGWSLPPPKSTSNNNPRTILVVNKPFANARYPFLTPTEEETDQLVQVLNSSSSNVLKMDLALLSFAEQVRLLQQVDVFVSPGGGIAFSLMFLPRGTKVLVCPYGQETITFLLSCGYLDMHYFSFSRECGGFPLVLMNQTLHDNAVNSCQRLNSKGTCIHGKWNEHATWQQAWPWPF